MATNEDLYREIVEMRADLTAHIATEEPVLQSARQLLETHGNNDLVKKRIEFINSWMEREADYKQLRRAVIEKTIIGALWAVLIFMCVAIGNELKDVIHGTSTFNNLHK